MFVAVLRSHRLRHIAESLLFPLLVVAAWFYYPYAFDGLDLCLWRNLFGVDCISCGLTRAVCSVVHGDLLRAMHYNPLVLFVLPFLFYLSLLSTYRLRKTAN